MEKIYNCNVERALDLLGGKWGTLIISVLLKGTKKHKEQVRGIDGVNSRTFKHLAEHGIVRREVFAEVPPRVVYTITTGGGAPPSSNR